MVHCGGDIAAHCGASRSCDSMSRGTVVGRRSPQTRPCAGAGRPANRQPAAAGRMGGLPGVTAGLFAPDGRSEQSSDQDCGHHGPDRVGIVKNALCVRLCVGRAAKDKIQQNQYVREGFGGGRGTGIEPSPRGGARLQNEAGLAPFDRRTGLVTRRREPSSRWRLGYIPL